MRSALLAVLATCVVGCGGPTQPEILIESSSVEVFRSRTRTLVPVRALLTNTGESSVMLRDCYDVEKQVDDEWVVGYSGSFCLLQLVGREVRPGEDVWVSHDLYEQTEAEGGTVFPHGIPGRYRMKLDIATLENGNWVDVSEAQRTFEFQVVE